MKKYKMDLYTTNRLEHIKWYYTGKQLINTPVHICSFKGLQSFEIFIF